MVREHTTRRTGEKIGDSAPFIEKKIGDSAPFIMEQKRSVFNSLPTRRAAAIPSGHLWVT